MRAALSKSTLEAELVSRFGQDVFKLTDRVHADVISTGFPELDTVAGGLPRGAITEVYGAESSGRTSFLISTLAYATTHDEVCALVDTHDVLDPNSTAVTGVNLDRLLWIRCAGNLERSFKAVDLLLQGGGFGLVALDLGDLPANEARRIISSWWYRFRRVVENTPTALIVIARDTCVRSCASLTLGLASKEFLWSKMNLETCRLSHPATNTARQTYPVVTHGNILRSSSIEIECIKPISRSVIADCRFQLPIFAAEATS